MVQIIVTIVMQTITVILSLVIFSLADYCRDNPVAINEEFMSCCNGRPLYSSENCIDALLESNKFSPECFVECAYQDFQIYDGTSFDLAAVKTTLDNQILNQDFNLLYMEAFEKCSKLEKSTASEVFAFVNITKNGHGCDKYPYYIDMCVWYYTLANCPEKYATDNEVCQSKREWVHECLINDEEK